MSALKEIIRECVMRGIGVELYKQSLSADGMEYVVQGFAKSGNAKLYENSEGVIEAHCRYGEVTEIETFEDLARLCYTWCSSYTDYSTGDWQTTFIEYGWIEEVKQSSKWKFVK